METGNYAREAQIAAASYNGVTLRRLAGFWWSDYWITPVLGYAISLTRPLTTLHVKGVNPGLQNLHGNRVLVRIQRQSHCTPALALGEPFALDIPLDAEKKSFELVLATLHQIEAGDKQNRRRGCCIHDIRFG